MVLYESVNRGSLKGHSLIKLAESYQSAYRSNLVVWPHLHNTQHATKRQNTTDMSSSLLMLQTEATRKHNVSSHNEADILTRHMSHRAKSCYEFHKLAPVAGWHSEI